MGKLTLHKTVDLKGIMIVFCMEVENGQTIPAEWLIHKIAPYTILRPTFKDSPRIRLR